MGLHKCPGWLQSEMENYTWQDIQSRVLEAQKRHHMSVRKANLTELGELVVDLWQGHGISCVSTFACACVPFCSFLELFVLLLYLKLACVSTGWCWKGQDLLVIVFMCNACQEQCSSLQKQSFADQSEDLLLSGSTVNLAISGSCFPQQRRRVWHTSCPILPPLLCLTGSFDSLLQTCAIEFCDRRTSCWH